MSKPLKKKAIWQIIGLTVLTLGLFTSLDLGKQVTKFWSEATGEKAKIVVLADKELGLMPRPWNNLAQGGESNQGMLAAAAKQISDLKPNYIRIDHIYDFYGTVGKKEGKINLNWEKLDKEVDVILRTGAKPMLALSYMPPDLAPNVTDKPNSWNEWQELVKATIEHYSGKNNKNIDNVYYEVWNEPDLFGSWKTFGEKNYLELYRQAALGAMAATNVQTFKLGGPGTTGMYANWMEALLLMVNEENLRFDYISWHRYTLNPEDFSQDIDTLNLLMGQYPKLALKERLITEWGLDSNNNPIYDNQTGAAYTLAAIREMLGKVNKTFIFEIKDGLDPEGKALWGRFGLVTHEQSNLQLKPRYKAIQWLNQLGKIRLALNGEGSWVKGMASKTDNIYQIDLVNYDSSNQHQELVPVSVQNLPAGDYELTKEDWSGKKIIAKITVSQNTWTDQILMQPNQIVRLRFKTL